MELTETKVRFTQHREANQERLQWRFTLESASNGEPLSESSEGYNNVSEMVHAFEVTTGSMVTGPIDEEGAHAIRYVFDTETMHLLRDVIEIVVEKDA